MVLARDDEEAAEAEAVVLSVLDDEERATLSSLVDRIVEANLEGRRAPEGLGGERSRHSSRAPDPQPLTQPVDPGLSS